jgi:hypothetical protein
VFEERLATERVIDVANALLLLFDTIDFFPRKDFPSGDATYRY